MTEITKGSDRSFMMIKGNTAKKYILEVSHATSSDYEYTLAAKNRLVDIYKALTPLGLLTISYPIKDELITRDPAEIFKDCRSLGQFVIEDKPLNKLCQIKYELCRFNMAPQYSVLTFVRHHDLVTFLIRLTSTEDIDNIFRSILVQVACTILTIKHKYPQFTHADLHANNVMLEIEPNNTGFIRFSTDGRPNIDIDLRSPIVKIIDFEFAQIDEQFEAAHAGVRRQVVDYRRDFDFQRFLITAVSIMRFHRDYSAKKQEFDAIFSKYLNWEFFCGILNRNLTTIDNACLYEDPDFLAILQPITMHNLLDSVRMSPIDGKPIKIYTY